MVGDGVEGLEYFAGQALDLVACDGMLAMQEVVRDSARLVGTVGHVEDLGGESVPVPCAAYMSLEASVSQLVEWVDGCLAG